MTLLPGPCSTFAGAPEERIAELLARPSGMRSINRPVVALVGGILVVTPLAGWILDRWG